MKILQYLLTISLVTCYSLQTRCMDKLLPQDKSVSLFADLNNNKITAGLIVLGSCLLLTRYCKKSDHIQQEDTTLQNNQEPTVPQPVPSVDPKLEQATGPLQPTNTNAIVIDLKK